MRSTSAYMLIASATEAGMSAERIRTQPNAAERYLLSESLRTAFRTCLMASGRETGGDFPERNSSIQVSISSDIRTVMGRVPARGRPPRFFSDFGTGTSRSGELVVVDATLMSVDFDFIELALM